MFGYKLMLVKKSDLHEQKVFKNVVYDLYDIIDAFKRFILEGFDLNRDTTTLFTEFNDELGVYVDMYFQNKYSLPSNALIMYKEMNSVRGHTTVIIDAIVEYNKILTVQGKYEETCKQFGNEYEFAEESVKLKDEIQQGYQAVTMTIGKACGYIINSLELIHHSVCGDKHRIDSDFDFVEAYKKRLKRIPKDKKLMSEFTVKYALNTRSDKEFLLKEKVRNEQRSGTRTADGGSKETV